jgi:hypothetical protein
MENNSGGWLRWWVSVTILAIYPTLMLAESPSQSKPWSATKLNELWERSKAVGGLKIGMSLKEVQAAVGEPDNSDREIVWLWVEKNPGKLSSWREMLSRRKKFGTGIFLIFKDGKLASPSLRLTTKEMESLFLLDRTFPADP